MSILDEAQEFMQGEILSKVMPLIKKLAPKAKEGIKKYLKGEEEEGPGVGKKKSIMINLVTNEQGEEDVAVWVFDENGVAIEMESEETVIGAHSAEQWLEGMLTGETKMLGK